MLSLPMMLNPCAFAALHTGLSILMDVSNASQPVDNGDEAKGER
jgi:hypothetical protein